MYRFKEKHRDDKIVIPSIRLVVTSENVNQWAELIFKEFPAHKDMIEFVEEEKVKKVVVPKEEKPVSSPPSKIED